MNQPKFTVLILATLVLSLFTFACKDYITAPENIDKFKNNDSSYKVILPINLEEFNIVAKNGTKSSSADTEKFSLDSSMLNWSGILQENRINGIVFTQVPFKMNDSTVIAAISNSTESLKDYKSGPFFGWSIKIKLEMKIYLFLNMVWLLIIREVFMKCIF